MFKKLHGGREKLIFHVFHIVPPTVLRTVLDSGGDVEELKRRKQGSRDAGTHRENE